MERDRNLLFGIFAVQIRGVSPKQIVEAAAAWATDPSRSLSARLVEQGAISASDIELINKLVDAAVQAHQGDASQALDRLGGEDQVNKTFCGSIVLRPSGGLETRPMASDSFFGLDQPVPILSAVEEYPGRYSQVSEYGRGGMGRVLLVHDEHMGREVALKELLLPKSEWPGPGDSPVRESAAYMARFLQEARLTGKLEHPAIVPVYELGRRKDGTLYYTMKLVRGKTLAKALKECRTLTERLGLLSNFVDICQAIAYAHSRGVIHRDIKPANVMVGAFGETIVLDWGLAKARGIDDVQGAELESTIRNLRLKKTDPLVTPFETRAGEAVGTPHYMSPEQAEGRIAEVDERSDVYSLGVVLYELLTGHVPHEGTSVEEVLWAVSRSEPKPILDHCPEAPPELVQVCMKALRRDPAKRYPTAGDLARDIKNFQTGSMVSAYSYTPAEMIRRYYARHRPLVNTIAAAAFILLGVGLYSYVSIFQARNRERAQRLVAEAAQRAAEDAKKAESVSRDEAERRTYLSQLNLAQEFLNARNYERARATLWATNEGRREFAWSLLLNQAYPDRFTVQNPASTIFGARYSPDGKRIAAVSEPDPPKIYDADTGALLLTMETAAGNPTDFAFSPDGGLLAVTDINGNLRLWDSTSGHLAHTIHAHDNLVSSLAFGADSKTVVTGGKDGPVRLWNTRTGEKIAEVVPSPATGKVLFNPDNTLIATEGGDKVVRVYAADLTKLAYQVPGISPHFSPDGRFLVTDVTLGEQIEATDAVAELEAHRIALWDALDGHELRRLSENQGTNLTVEFDKDSARLLAGGFARGLRVWDTKTGKLLTELPIDQVLNAAFSAEPDKLLVQRMNGLLEVWNLETHALTDTFAQQGKTSTYLDVDPTRTRAVTTTSQNSFQAWDFLSPPGRKRYATNSFTRPSFLAKSLDGTTLARSDEHGLVVINTQTGALRRFADATSNEVVALSQDGKKLAGAPGGDVAIVWNIDDETKRCEFNEHTGKITAVCFSADGRHVATGSEDKTVRIWSADTGVREHLLEGHGGTINTVAFDPEGKNLASGGDDMNIIVWDAMTGKALNTLSGHKHRITSLNFSHDGQQIVSGSWDYTARVWSLATGEASQVLEGHGGFVDSAAFALNDRYILTSGYDRTTRIWDAKSAQQLSILQDAGPSVVANATRVFVYAINSTTIEDLELPQWETTGQSNFATSPTSPINTRVTQERDRWSQVSGKK